MPINKKVIFGNAIVFAIFGSLSLVFGLAGLGAMSILYAAVNLLISLIYLFTKDYRTFQTSLLISGVLFLIGFGLCSGFKFIPN